MTSSSPNPATLYRTLPGQGAAENASIILLSPVTGERVALRDTARRVWERLDYPVSVETLTTRLAAEYDAPEQEIGSGIETIVAGLVELGLVAEHPRGRGDPLRDRYLSLLKHTLANTIYPELELQIEHLERGADGLAGIELQRFQRDIGIRQPDKLARALDGKQQGTGSLRFAHTMIGLFRLNNIERCAEQVLAEGVPGDFLEAGVCKGGAAIFMRALQIAHNAPERKTWLVDSFAGVPPSDQECDSRHGLHLDESRVPWLACSESAVREHFSRYELLDSNVEFVAGWLSESLPRTPIGKLAILRVDVDLYSSTLECLDLLYDNVSPGGFVIVDDYGYLECCREAVDEFRDRAGVEEPIRWIDESAIFWRKAAETA